MQGRIYLMSLSTCLSLLGRNEVSSLRDPSSILLKGCYLDAWEVTQALRLDSAVRLESFHICAFPNLTLPLAVAMSRMTQATECLLRILSTLAPTIKRVTIEIGPSDIVQDPPIMWETLAMVEWQRFVDLERVTVFMRRGGSTQAAEEIRQKLRILDKKGLLSIAGDQGKSLIVLVRSSPLRGYFPVTAEH